LNNDWWRFEIWRLIIVGLLIVMTIAATGRPWLSALLWLCVYLAFHLIDMVRFKRWIFEGSRTHQLPDFQGVWEMLASIIVRDRKQILKEKRRQQTILAQFNSTAEALPDATVLLDSSMRVLWMNSVAGDVLGIHFGTDVGQRIDNLIRDPKFHHQIKTRDHRQAVELQHPTDDTRTILIRLIRFAHDRILLIGQDISERKRLQRSRRAFIANASHELKTPLTVISGYLDAISADRTLDQELRPAIEQSQQQSLRMKQIIEDMLSLSRIEHQESGPTKPENVDMDLLIRKVAGDLTDTIEADSHPFKLSLDAGLHCHGSLSDLESLCQNLMGNALKHTPAGTTVEVSWKMSDEGRPQLIVRDDGPGVARKHIPHLTERFYRVHGHQGSSAQGTGLGLAIVKHIVMMHGGELDIQSSQGKGTSFTVSFLAENRLPESESKT